MTTKYDYLIQRLDMIADDVSKTQTLEGMRSFGEIALAYAIAYLAESMVENDGLNIHLTTHKGK